MKSTLIQHFLLVVCLTLSIFKNTIGKIVPITNESRLYHIHQLAENHGAVRNFSNLVRATHNANHLIGDRAVVAEQIVVELPYIGDVTFSRRSYEVIGSEVKEYDSIHRVWSGDIIEGTVHIDGTSVLGRADFVLLPNNGLSCQIKVGSQKYRCLPCSSTINSSQDCINIESIDAAIPENTQKQLSKGKEVPDKKSTKLFSPRSRNIVENRSLQENMTVIDVLILYTPAVTALLGSDIVVQAEIAIAVAQSNKVFINSLIDLKIQIVGWQEIDYIETGEMDDSLNFLTFNEDVAILRDDFGADLVLMLTSDFALNDALCNYSWMPNPVSEFTDIYTFSVVDAFCLLNHDHQFPSVWGRTFGCDDDFENSDMDRVLDYAYGYLSSECDFSTILGTSCGGPQLSYYSTPLLQWEETGEWLGSRTADCSRIIREYKDIVSQYRNTVADLKIIEPTVFPTNTYAPTPQSTLPWVELVSDNWPTVAPTQAPTNTLAAASLMPVANCPGECFSIQFDSILINQETWDDAELKDIFVTAIQDLTRSVLNAEESMAFVKKYQVGSYSLYDSYGYFNVPAVKITYTIKFIYTEAAMYNVSEAIYTASDNGELPQTLVDSSLLYTCWDVITKQVVDREISIENFILAR